MSYNGQTWNMNAVRQHYQISYGGLNISRTLAGLVKK